MNIKGQDKAVILAALYNGSRPLGMGMLHYDPRPMTVEEARTLLEKQQYFDYLKGRVMKVDLSRDEVDLRLYDRDVGPGAGESAILEALTRP